MAFRNSVKATLLLELEQPRSRSDEARPEKTWSDKTGPIFKPQPAPAPERPVAQRATDSPVQRGWKSVAPRTPDDAFLAATWHARAEELCAMADTLPSKASWSLISKIAVLYDEIARDAGWCEEDVLPAPDAGAAPALEEAADALAAEAPELRDPPAELRAVPPLAFPRRPLPFGRPTMRRRA